MSFCTNCGQELMNGANFCSNCGNPVNEIKSTDRRSTVYDGELHKCPNCGELLKSFTSVCPTCGYELRGVKTRSTVETLAKKIEHAPSLENEIELITNFYIPNTKEDIYDFFILAVSNLEDKNFDTDNAWRAKLEQAYHKAKLSFGTTSEFEYLEKLYKKTRKEVSKRERGPGAIFRRHKAALIGILIAVIGFAMLAAGIVLNAHQIDGDVLIGLSIFCFIFCPIVIICIKDAQEDEKKKKSKKKSASKKSNGATISVGRDAEEFYSENFEDAVEFLQSRGFSNITTKPVKKGVLDTDGDLEGISISGLTEFSEYDEFNKDSKIIIRYYSKTQ